MAWTNVTFAFGSILTSTKMTQLDDNFEALANGDSGSPKIQEAAITGQAAVDRSALKTGVSGASGNVGANTQVNIAMTDYSLFPMFHSTGGEIIMGGHITDGGGASVPRFSARNLNGKTSGSYDADWRYIAA